MQIREQILEMIAQGVDPQEARNRVFIDTHKYYTEDLNRRCTMLGEIYCFYSPKKANKEGISEGCAVGRLLLDVEKESLDLNFSGTFDERACRYLGDESKSIIDYLGDDFLRNLQMYHDKYIINRYNDIPVEWLFRYRNLIKDEV